MDIMCGLCQILGIRLTENFERPYFSKSIAEYWRRWHISLGVWFKNYVYYPIAMARWNQGRRGGQVAAEGFSQALLGGLAQLVPVGWYVVTAFLYIIKGGL